MQNEVNDISLKSIIEQETGRKLNRENKMSCPFHGEKTPSLSVRFNPDTGKEQFKCFGCGASGDVIDFVKQIRGIDFMAAKKYLGLAAEKTLNEKQLDEVNIYINWELGKFRKGQKLIGIFTYVDYEGSPIYYKAKFRRENGEKDISYYNISSGKVSAKRGCDEVPYNLSEALKAKKDNKIIIICEGEKDCNTLNHILRGKPYTATSVKGCKDISMFEDARIFVCGDTGEAGYKYKGFISGKLLESSKEYRVINLPGLAELGDNKDVTDWISSGHTAKELAEAFSRSLDIKNKHELQQDKGGIYKIVFKEKAEEITETKVYLTNFQIAESTAINYVDRDMQGIKLKCSTINGELFEKTSDVNVFDDLKSFRNSLGSMELTYSGNMADLILLKKWINRYFVFKTINIYESPKFEHINEKLYFITKEGALGSEGMDMGNTSESNFNIDIMDSKPIERDELAEVLKHLFEFCMPGQSYSIIGTAINNLAIAQAIESDIKFHHLLLVGESGSGKTTILNNVLAPLLNYPQGNIKSIGLITAFAMIKEISSGNYPIIFDEFKPSRMDRYKIAKISEMLRNTYDRAIVSRGDKTLKTINFMLARPLIMAGEESYPAQEKALIERSCIIYLSKNERKREHTEAMRYLSKNEKLLNKLNRSLIDIILNLSAADYANLRETETAKIKSLKDRPKGTALNICTGIAILNKLLRIHGLPLIEKYVEEVESNIVSEILEDGFEAHSEVENMLELFNQLIENGRITTETGMLLRRKGDEVYIRTSEMLTQLRVHIKNTDLDSFVLDEKDFKKQARKSGYMLKSSDGAVFKINNSSVRFDGYDAEKLRKLRLDAIAPPDLVEEAWEVGEECKVVDFRQQVTKQIKL